MSLSNPNELFFRSAASCCHVCSRPVDFDDVAVVHDGYVGIEQKTLSVEGSGQIVMHTECATVLAMRLIADVMAQRVRPVQSAMRVVEVLNKNRRDK